MPDPLPPPPPERRLHTSQLAGFIARAQQTLALHGVSPDRSAALLGSTLASTCVTCGLVMRGDELLQLTAPPDSSAAANPRLDRLRQGYCARTGCDSYFVNVSFVNRPELDWSKVLAEMDAAVPSEATEAALAQARAAAPRRQQRMRLAAGLVLVLLALAIRQRVLHRPIPFFYEPKHFAVDSNSVPSQTRK